MNDSEDLTTLNLSEETTDQRPAATEQPQSVESAESMPADDWTGPFSDSISSVPDKDFVPDSFEETSRKSGLAWSAGIVFFSSIAFCLFLGWLADLLLGSSPWGIVGGIVLGSLIGFIQFFRITSQIFEKSKPQTPPRTLLGDRDDDR